MAGGLLNIISEGNNSVILTGNPSKTFFKVKYSKYTNFGLQKFRIDYDGTRDLRLSEESTFKFKIKRYAELLMDTYLVITLPDVWSPIYHPVSSNEITGHHMISNGLRILAHKSYVKYLLHVVLNYYKNIVVLIWKQWLSAILHKKRRIYLMK